MKPSSPASAYNSSRQQQHQQQQHQPPPPQQPRHGRGHDHHPHATTTSSTTAVHSLRGVRVLFHRPRPVYREEILGCRIEVLFTVSNKSRFYSGVVRAYEVFLKDDGSFGCGHHIVFDDGDEGWFDLMAMEKRKHIRWVVNSTDSNSSGKEDDDDEEEEEEEDANDDEEDAHDDDEDEGHVPAGVCSFSKSNRPSARKSPEEEAAAVEEEEEEAEEEEEQDDEAEEEEDEQDDDNTAPTKPANVVPRVSTPRRGSRIVEKQPAVSPVHTPSSLSSSKRREEEKSSSSDHGSGPLPMPAEKEDETLFHSPYSSGKKRKRSTNEEKEDKNSSSHTGDGSPVTDDWLEDFYQFLITTPRGKDNRVSSVANAKVIHRQVKKLISGAGISYKRWPSGVCFYKDVKLNMWNVDFDELMQQAVEHEHRYGSDTGNGWLMRHPLESLRLYRQHCYDKERA